MRVINQLKFLSIVGMTSLIMACSSNPKVEDAAPTSTPVPNAPARVDIVDTVRGPTLTLDDVQFDFEQSSLRPEAGRIIAKAAAYLQEKPDRYALVEGHTDTSGDSSYNQALSLERSESIKNALIDAGISKFRIRTRGLGETQPVADNSTLSGRQANRRVEIIFKEYGTSL